MKLKPNGIDLNIWPRTGNEIPMTRHDKMISILTETGWSPIAVKNISVWNLKNVVIPEIKECLKATYEQYSFYGGDELAERAALFVIEQEIKNRRAGLVKFERLKDE